jgi:hypothetical protein
MTVDGAYQQDPTLGSPFNDNHSLGFTSLSPNPSSRALAAQNGDDGGSVTNDGMGMGVGGNRTISSDPRLTPPAHRRSIADDDIDEPLDGVDDNDGDNDDDQGPRRSAVAGGF